MSLLGVFIRTCVLQSTSRSLQACTLVSNFTRLNFNLCRSCSYNECGMQETHTESKLTKHEKGVEKYKYIFPGDTL